MARYLSNVHSRNQAYQAVDVHDQEQYYWCPVPIVILASVGDRACQKGIGREDEGLETGLVGMI